MKSITILSHRSNYALVQFIDDATGQPVKQFNESFFSWSHINSARAAARRVFGKNVKITIKKANDYK